MEPFEGRFFGRERLLREIAAAIRAPQPPSFCLVGPRFAGKTRILRHLSSPPAKAQAGDPATRPLVTAYVDCSGIDAKNDIVDAIITRLAQQLRSEATMDFEWDQSGGQSDAGRRLVTIGQSLATHGVGMLLLLDNFHSLLQEDLPPRETIDVLGELGDGACIIVTSEQPAHDLSYALVAGSFLDGVTQRFLGVLDEAGAQAWIGGYYEEYPGLAPVAEELLSMTGCHPYLLSRLGAVLSETLDTLPHGQQLESAHLPLLRMRLAEHGRLLFAMQWNLLQSPPHRVNGRGVMRLLDRMVLAPFPPEEATGDVATALNWLINQAIVVYDACGYRYFSPLLTEYLEQRIRTGIHAPAAAVDGDGPFHSSLTKTENALLCYFQANSETIISPEELLADVWNRPDASPRRVQEAIRRLRLRLDEAVPSVGRIENERGRGYRFVPAKP